MRILALDVALSSVRAAVLDTEAADFVSPLAEVPFERHRPTPETDEVPAVVLWDAFTCAARQATRGQEGIEGIGLSCFSPAMVLTGEKGTPLLPIRTPLDRRARPAARQVWAAVGEEFLQSTGMRPLPGGCFAVTLRQIVNDVHHVDREFRALHSLNGWLAFQLTGERFIDLGNASQTGLFNTFTDRQWSSRWCEFFCVDPDWLPRVVCGSTTVGTLRPAIAVELGLPPGLPVKLGSDDLASCVLAANLKRGDELSIDGDAVALLRLVEKPIADANRITRMLGIGDAFLYVTYHPVGGAALEWLYRLCFRDQSRQQFYSATIKEAAERSTRVTLDPIHIAGDRLEIEAHRAAFRGLTLATDRMDLLAALLRIKGEATVTEKEQTPLILKGIRHLFTTSALFTS